MSGKSDAELKDIVQDKDGYLPEAREAATLELGKRSNEETTDDIEVLSMQQFAGESSTEASPEMEVAKERLFQVNWEAPNMVLIIGFGLYVLLGFSLYENLNENTVYTVNGRVIFHQVFIVLVCFGWALMIDGILKGKVWSRATYASLFVFLVTWKLAKYVLIPSFSIELLELFRLIVEIILVALLFVQPASSWFVPNKKKKVETVDLLDDL